MERKSEDEPCCLASRSLAKTALSVDASSTVPPLHAEKGAAKHSMLIFERRALVRVSRWTFIFGMFWVNHRIWI